MGSVVHNGDVQTSQPKDLMKYRSTTRALYMFTLALPFAICAAACGGDDTSSDAPGSADGGPRGDATPATDGAITGDSGGAGAPADAAGLADARAPGDSGEAADAAAALGPARVSLGSSGNYVVLAKSAISNVPTSAITGDVAVSPAAATYITGFALTKAGAAWTSPQVAGSVFAADNDVPTPNNLTTAIGAMQTAYTDAAGRTSPDHVNLGAGAIGGLTLTPGLYRWNSTVTVPIDVTLSGGPNDIFIFQITGDLKMSAATAMKLVGGAQAKNVFWQVAGFVELGTTSHAEGIVLAQTKITFGKGASIHGRLFAQTAISLAASAVTSP